MHSGKICIFGIINMTKDKLILFTIIVSVIIYYFVYERYLFPKIARLEWAKKIFKTDESIKRGFLYRLCLILGFFIIAVVIGLFFKSF